MGGALARGDLRVDRGAGVGRLLAWWVASFYVGAQSFQREADERRGYRTLVVVHGARRTVALARMCWWLGVGTVVTLGAVGWFPELVIGVVPVALWVDRALGRPPSRAVEVQRFVRRALVCGATLLGLVSLHHLHARETADAVAGLATRRGHR